MIVRIMSEGQHDLPDDAIDALNRLDEQVERAVESGDEPAFSVALRDLLSQVRELGRPLPDDALMPSAVVLPPPDATIDDVRHLFDGDGLVPG